MYKLRRAFCKCANRKYVPMWMNYVQSILLIVDGLVNLVSIPFGYKCGISIDWSAHMLKTGFENRKKERR